MKSKSQKQRICLVNTSQDATVTVPTNINNAIRQPVTAGVSTQSPGSSCLAHVRMFVVYQPLSNVGNRASKRVPVSLNQFVQAMEEHMVMRVNWRTRSVKIKS